MQQTPAWKSRTACTGLDPNLFVRETDTQTDKVDATPHPLAVAACRTCTVSTWCLDAILEYPATVGTFAGIGINKRRRYRRLKVEAAHDYQPSCDCAYCTALGDHADQLRNPDETPVSLRIVDSNGTGARCGKVSTHGRGHRDTACVYASNKAWRDRTTIDIDGPVRIARPRSFTTCPHGPGRCTACAVVDAYTTKAAA